MAVMTAYSPSAPHLQLGGAKSRDYEGGRLTRPESQTLRYVWIPGILGPKSSRALVMTFRQSAFLLVAFFASVVAIFGLVSRDPAYTVLGVLLGTFLAASL